MDTIVTYHVEGDRDTPSGEVFAEQLDVLDQAWRGGPVALRGVYLEVEAPPIDLQSASALRRAVSFTAFHIQPRWAGLAPPDVEASIVRFQRDVLPAII